MEEKNLKEVLMVPFLSLSPMNNGEPVKTRILVNVWGICGLHQMAKLHLL